MSATSHLRHIHIIILARSTLEPDTSSHDYESDVRVSIIFAELSPTCTPYFGNHPVALGSSNLPISMYIFQSQIHPLRIPTTPYLFRSGRPPSAGIPVRFLYIASILTLIVIEHHQRTFPPTNWHYSRR